VVEELKEQLSLLLSMILGLIDTAGKGLITGVALPNVAERQMVLQKPLMMLLL